MMTDATLTRSDDRHQLQAQLTYSTSEPVNLSTSNASGRVEVITNDTLAAGTVNVTATRTDNGTFDEDDHHLSVRADGNSLSVHPDWQFAAGVSGLARRLKDQLQHGFRPEDWNLSRLRLRPELDFHITIELPSDLPEGSQAKIRTASGTAVVRNLRAACTVVTASGDVEATGTTGTTAIHTASGDVEARNTNGSLEINTASGDVTIDGGDAWLAARSASGDIDIHNFQPKNTRITTVSGDIALTSTLTNTAVGHNMETVSGDIRLAVTLPGSGTAATLGFGTISGSSSASGAWEQQKRRQWRAGTGDKAITLNVKTVSGDLSATATLDPSVEARSIELPTVTEEDTGSAPFEEDDIRDFKDEMKEFGKEMKAFGKEIRRAVDSDTPATPPPPPTPPQATEPVTPTPPEPPKDRSDDAIFTAGVSGKPYRSPRANQETEPVEPTQPYTDAPSEAPAADAPANEAPDSPKDERLELLEAVERGELTIEEALSRLNSDNDA